MADPVRESAARPPVKQVIAHAIHAALCSDCDPSAGTGLTIRAADVDKAVPAVLDALTAAGIRLAMPGEVVVRLPEVEVSRADGHTAVVAKELGGFPAYVHGRVLPRQYADHADYVSISAAPIGWRGLDAARAHALRVLAVVAAIERATSPAEPTDHPGGER